MTFRSPDQIAQDGMPVSAVGMSAVVVARAQAAASAPVYASKGAALAALAIAEARQQGSAWGRFYRDMLALESEGRKAFRSAISAHQRAMQGHVTATKNEDGKPNPVYEGAKRSAMVRLSELTTISNALDAHVEFDATWPFHTAVSHARLALRSKSAGSTRGRPATPWLDKVKAYLIKTVPEGEMETCLELVETMAKTQE